MVSCMGESQEYSGKGGIVAGSGGGGFVAPVAPRLQRRWREVWSASAAVEARHPPVEAGTQLLAFLACRGFAARFRPPRRRPSHFLLLAQEKVTKEKGTPEARPEDIPVLRDREAVPGFSDGTSVYRGKRAGIVPAPLRA